MTDTAEISTMADALRQQLAQVHGLKARSLEAALRKSRRVLPRALRRKGDALAEAARMEGNPKLGRMLDVDALRSAYADVAEHLAAVDVADIRRGRILRMLGAIALKLLLVAGVFLWWMVWRGYL